MIIIMINMIITGQNRGYIKWLISIAFYGLWEWIEWCHPPKTRINCLGKPFRVTHVWPHTTQPWLHILQVDQSHDVAGEDDFLHAWNARISVGCARIGRFLITWDFCWVYPFSLECPYGMEITEIGGPLPDQYNTTHATLNPKLSLGHFSQNREPREPHLSSWWIIIFQVQVAILG